MRDAQSLLTRFWSSVNQSLDRFRFRQNGVEDCRAICLALGPYRNLTTLTAATLFLHPNCQVLNHAGNQIYCRPRINFLRDFSTTKLDRFVRFAVFLSRDGKRGAQGGSITHSHAFDEKHNMKQTFEKGGHDRVKQVIRCLFWKESLDTSNYVRDNRIELSDMLKRDPRLRFLMPIRNPMDCAISNLKTGHFRKFHGLGPTPAVTQVLAAVLTEICWFAELKQATPDRFFWFFEDQISLQVLEKMASFLELDPTDDWLASAQAVMTPTKGYEHDPELRESYALKIAELKKRFPELHDGLERFQ